ncbi:hypothetical protein B0T19DRAFT_34134 [Cercophora scortea]|uniref:Uncharacterized protein n=1 Tax=Cercophora scortea TaxID=314031 RepID=A0AAE0J4A1_9PEZI|nr:hypothetical protein B0T19DRAFT_34134 [Cercophora scortea]
MGRACVFQHPDLGQYDYYDNGTKAGSQEARCKNLQRLSLRRFEVRQNTPVKKKKKKKNHIDITRAVLSSATFAVFCLPTAIVHMRRKLCQELCAVQYTVGIDQRPTARFPGPFSPASLFPPRPALSPSVLRLGNTAADALDSRCSCLTVLVSGCKSDAGERDG